MNKIDQKIEDFLNKNTENFILEIVERGLRQIIEEEYVTFKEKNAIWLSPKITIDIKHSRTEKVGFFINIYVETERRGVSNEDFFKFVVWPKNFKDYCH